jgi:hypothetical protein
MSIMPMTGIAMVRQNRAYVLVELQSPASAKILSRDKVKTSISQDDKDERSQDQGIFHWRQTIEKSKLNPFVNSDAGENISFP